jgi:hypothetical protein
MFKSVALVLTFVAAFLVSSASASPPSPSKSEYLTTEGAGFLMDKGEGVIYAMTFSLRKEINEPLYVEVLYENPADSKAPFVVNATIAPGQKELLSESPGIPAIKNRKNYRVEVRLFSDEAHTHLVSKHAQDVLFEIPKGLEDLYQVKLL